LAPLGSVDVDYRRFEATTDAFGAPVVVATAANDDAGDLDVSQDDAGGVYAVWRGSIGPVLSYSSNAGASWTTPQPIGLTGDGQFLVAGIGGGKADVAYNDGSQEYLLPVTYSQLGAADSG
jgi:hypothetical protein